MSDHERLAALALDLVNIPSVSRDEAAITSWMAERLEAVRHLQPDALAFGPPGPVDVVLAGHSDTVPAQGNLPGRLDGQFVHGLGACDMKGSLAVMLELARDLAGARLNPLFVVFGREELPLAESVLDGLFDSCPELSEARLVVMMEPTANSIQAGCLGNIKADLEFSGVAAHSARPWLGENAIHKAVLALQAVATAAPQPVEIGGLEFKEVLSVTEIAGGIANNVIPDRVTCGLNFRYAGTRSPEQAEQRLRELVGPAGRLTVLSNAPGAPVNVENKLLERLRRSGEEEEQLPLQPKQAWTPVAEFAQRGLDAVNFGPGDPELAHRRDERIAVEAMVANLHILRRFLCG